MATMTMIAFSMQAFPTSQPLRPLYPCCPPVCPTSDSPYTPRTYLGYYHVLGGKNIIISSAGRRHGPRPVFPPRTQSDEGIRGIKFFFFLDFRPRPFPPPLCFVPLTTVFPVIFAIFCFSSSFLPSRPSRMVFPSQYIPQYLL